MVGIVFGGLIINVVGLAIIQSDAYGDVVAKGKDSVVVMLSDVEKAQFSGSLPMFEVDSDVEFKDTPTNSLIPIYQLFKFRFVNVDNDSQLTDDKIMPTKSSLEDLNLLVRDFEGLKYIDSAIDGDVITFRYSAIVANGSSVNEKTIEKQILEDTLPLGSAGRLYLPSLGLSIRLNECVFSLVNGSSYQQNVSFSDTGAIGQCGGEKVVEDLLSQGFGSIANLATGDTVYIKTPQNTVDWYSCVNGGAGTFSDQFYFGGHPLSVLNNGGIALCCKYDANHCHVKLLQKA